MRQSRGFLGVFLGADRVPAAVVVVVVVGAAYSHMRNLNYNSMYTMSA